MKNVLTLSLLSLAMAGPALADNTAQSNANAGAAAQAGANANGNSLNANLAGGSAGASAITGSSSAAVAPITISTGAVTVTPTQTSTLATGDVTVTPTQTSSASTGAVTLTPTQTSSASTGPMTNNLTIEASAPTKIPVGVPGAVAPAIPSAQIFGGLNAPTTVAGIPLVLEYMEACKPVATRANDLRDIYGKGVSGYTQVVFSPNQGYYTHRTVLNQEVESVATVFPKQSAKFDCLGIVTVMAKKDAHGIPITTIFADARVYALREMEGFKKIELVSVRNAIATALGVSTAGSGFSLSPGLTSAAANVLTLGVLSAGYSNGTGGTYSDASIGDTFLVLAHTDGEDGVVIDPNAIQAAYPQPVGIAASENGKKLEATK